MADAALTTRDEITEAKLAEYLDAAGITSKLQPGEKKMFFNVAREFGLNPFKREVHVTAYGEGQGRKLSIITGYEVYIKRAERTGKLKGWSVKSEGEGEGIRSTVTIWRAGWDHPFSYSVPYKECVQKNRHGEPNAVWAQRPEFMTQKVAISQAFRLCFSDELGGMPYDESEMPQGEPRNVTEGAPVFVKPGPAPQTAPQTAPQSPAAGPVDWDKYSLGKEAPSFETRLQETMSRIGKVLNAQNGGGEPYFTDDNREEARRVCKESAKLEPPARLKALETELEIWSGALRDLQEAERREAEAAAEAEARNQEGGFEDDIPWGYPPPQGAAAGGGSKLEKLFD